MKKTIIAVLIAAVVTPAHAAFVFEADPLAQPVHKTKAVAVPVVQTPVAPVVAAKKPMTGTFTAYNPGEAEEATRAKAPALVQAIHADQEEIASAPTSINVCLVGGTKPNAAVIAILNRFIQLHGASAEYVLNTTDRAAQQAFGMTMARLGTTPIHTHLPFSLPAGCAVVTSQYVS